MTDHKPLNKYQLNVIVKEYVDTGENIVLSLLCDYTESCWGFEDVKKTPHLLKYSTISPTLFRSLPRIFRRCVNISRTGNTAYCLNPTIPKVLPMRSTFTSPETTTNPCHWKWKHTLRNSSGQCAGKKLSRSLMLIPVKTPQN